MMRQSSLVIAGLILTGALAGRQATCAVTPFVEIPSVEWIRQLGTRGADWGNGVSVDDYGNAYVTGYTHGSLDGNTSAGYIDMFLTKYDTVGNKLWTRQLGTSSMDEGNSVSVDSNGNAYVTGVTKGDLDGNISAGGFDMFLTKYDTAGTKQWTRQLGTGTTDTGRGVSVDESGNAYVTGITTGSLDGNTYAGGYDMFLTKYDTSGNKQWTRQLGTTGGDKGHSVSVDESGNAYVAGYTAGGLDGNAHAGNWDIFLTKYDTDGYKQWTRQLGTGDNDEADGVSVDSNGNAYVTGSTQSGLDGNTSAGWHDAFLIKYDTNGTKQWTRQLGSSGFDYGYGVSVDGSGNVYVTGETGGDLDGNSNAGGGDMFLTKYDSDGIRLWTHQLGTSAGDVGAGVSVDSNGNAYVTGRTTGDLNGSASPGVHDMFLVKISTIPEPSTIILLAMGAIGLVAYARWRRR